MTQNGLFRAIWKPGPEFQAAGRNLLDMIFPPQTLDGGHPSLSFGLSAESWGQIEFLDDPVCDGCATPFEFDQGPGARCAACMARPRGFDRARAACFYDEASRGPILQFKHADRPDLGVMFARWLSRSARDLLEEADALVPVPLHRTRLFSRRYNQAAEIARPLGRLTGTRVLADALVRGRNTGSQAGKSGSGRRRNVAAAFEVPAGRVRQVEGRRLLLIDDVMTTGATLEGCARALKLAGAAQVSIAVVSRVKDMANRPI